MSVNVRDIDPEALYSFTEAARLIPSSRSGKSLHVHTLYRWREEKKIKAVQVQGGWFIYGAEILKLLSADQAPEWAGRSPAQRQRASEAAMAELRSMGI